MFEDILRTEFSWPNAETSLLCGETYRHQTALLSNEAFGRHHMMETGYKLAADILADYAISSRADLDRLVYPIIFNYRHFLELSVKFIISYYGKMLDVDSVWTTHDLMKIWTIFKDMLVRIGEDVEKEDVKAVERVYGEFAKIDPDSSHFRYPRHKDGHIIQFKIEELDIGKLKETMDSIESFWLSADGVFGSYQDYLNDGVTCGY